MLVELNAVPIVLDVADPDQFVATVRAIAPGFAAIHLEDIATPAAYAIEDELDRRLPVPVMHDDQHGTAVVVIAAVLSAARLLGRPLERLRFGQFGLGAAGSAIARLALEFPFTRVVAFDPDAAAVARVTALSHGDRRLTAGADDDARDAALDEVDILVMTTGQAGLLPPERVHSGQAVFALSNPLPEITPEAALAAGAAIATDGAIVNNVLAYPGLFRGALDAGAGSISPAMKRAAARALTRLAPDDLLLPDPLDRDVHLEVAAAVAAAAG
jgi:malate dehydrogenase (oxaloacetate-decarboxylating)